MLTLLVLLTFQLDQPSTVRVIVPPLPTLPAPPSPPSRAPEISVCCGLPPIAVPPDEALARGKTKIYPTHYWDRVPSHDDTLLVYPRLADDKRVEGKVALTCAVIEKRHLGQCVIVSETPGNWGFGDAALKLTRYYRLNKADACADANGCVVRVLQQFYLLPGDL